MNNKNKLPKFARNEEAVSPIVATLFLVLITVGVAAGFFLFVGAFQDKAQENVNTDINGDCLTIGGSSTVYEFSLPAKALFEQATGHCVTLSSGGSGAGVQAIGICSIDIGSASRALKDTEIAAYPDCDGVAGKDFGADPLVLTTVAFDGVVPIVSNVAGAATLNTCSQAALDAFTAEEVEWIWRFNGFGQGAPAADVGRLLVADFVAPGVTWDDLDASCGTDVIIPVSRTDAGGTTEVFCEKMLDKACTSPILTETTWTFPGVLSGNLGNQGAELVVAADKDYLGYTSYGGDSTNSAVKGVLTIDGITASPTTIRDGTFVTARPINYVTVGEPSGVEKMYLDFVMLPSNNQEISKIPAFVPFFA